MTTESPIPDFKSVPDVSSRLEAEGYVADDALAMSLFLAVKMRRPLFLEGAPGVGKTLLATVTAKVFETELIRLQCYEGLDVSQAVYEWNYPRQLLELQSHPSHTPTSEAVYTEKFLLKRPLLRAIDAANDRSPVLLIDEIDRADEEFESFLLELLSDFQVTIPELGTLRAKHPPIVVLTSNRTRDVHDALKRRCLFHWIDYPTFEKEVAIVRRRVPGLGERLASRLVAFTQQLRKEDLTKVPGVAETVDWADALVQLGVGNADELDEKTVSGTLGLLLKYQDDVVRVRSTLGAKARAMSIQADVVAFVRRLREASLTVGVDQTETFARALALVDPLSRRELYLAARTALITRREDVPVFDAVFDGFWHGRAIDKPQKVPLAPRHDVKPFQKTALASYMSEQARPDAPDVDLPDEARAATDHDRLQTKDFTDLSAEERAQIARAMAELRLRPAMRRSRRLVPSRRGHTLDMRRVLRAASRHGGRAISLFRQTRKIKRRPLVVLADISGSMELYTRVLLQFFHALTQGHGMCETFVFGTRLTCITSELRLRDVDTAIDAAAREIVDFAGGTRIGESFHTFNRLHAPRVLRRGAVVIIVSDGWERGEPGRLARELERIRARCHRIIWLNPLLGRAGYEPLAAGMAAALPVLDDFLPLNNLQSVTSLSRRLATLPSRKGSKNHEARR